MGAVTALLHADRDPLIGAMCLDSPFSNLSTLAEELASSNRLILPIPSWLVSAAMALIRMRVQTLAGFDVEDVDPLRHAPGSFVPAMFMHGRLDTFVQPHHSQRLYDAYAGEKELVNLDGDHNSMRSDEAVKHAIAFFRRAFRLGEIDLSMLQRPQEEELASWGVLPEGGRKGSAPPPVMTKTLVEQRLPVAGAQMSFRGGA